MRQAKPTTPAAGGELDKLIAAAASDPTTPPEVAAWFRAFVEAEPAPATRKPTRRPRRPAKEPAAG
ncbi:MAG: hypothetical protein U0871_13640 [Gemmataceae bacterium]